MRINLINFSSYLLYLFPLALLTGPAIPETIIIIISTIFLIYSIREKSWYFYNNFFSIFFGSFCLYILIRSLISIDPLLSLESSLFYIRFPIFALAVWFLIENNSDLIRKFTIFLTITFIISFIDGAFQFHYEKNIFNIEHASERMSLLFSDKSILGSYLARLFPLFIGLIILNFHDSKYFLFYTPLLFVSSIILVYLSGERTAFGLICISVFFIFIFSRSLGRFKILIILLSFILLLLLTIYSPEMKKRYYVQTINQINSTFSYDTTDNSTSEKNLKRVIFSYEHNKLIRTAWNMFVDAPIFGHGPKTFRILCNDEKYRFKDNISHTSSCNTHPHNTYAQIMSETGMVGLTFFLLLFVIFIVKFTTNIVNILNKSNKIFSDYQICLLSCFILSLWPFLPSLNFFNNWISMIYFLPVGFFLHTIYNSKSI